MISSTNEEKVNLVVCGMNGKIGTGSFAGPTGEFEL